MISGGCMNKQEYSAWIRSVRGKMSQEEFGKKIIHYYSPKKGMDKICKTYHRNEVGLWEAGKSLPLNVETFISIALVEYDKNNRNSFVNNYERNQRLNFVSELIENILGIELYCRSLHDVLLIQVCRGVISFEDVLVLEPKYEKCISDVKLENEEKRRIALQRETQNIQYDVYKISSVKELDRLVFDYRVYFYTGNRTLGDHFNVLFEKKIRYGHKVSIQDAVCVFAPNYRDSYNRIFTSSSITRQWLLDLCIHLRMNRDEINTVLKYAHMVELSENMDDVEWFYREKVTIRINDGWSVNIAAPIGSGYWYKQLESQCIENYASHFAFFNKLPLDYKLKIALLMGIYIEQEYFENLPPIDYILESFSELYPQGKAAIKCLDKTLKTIDPNTWEYSPDLQYQLNDQLSSWYDYLRSGCEYAESDILQSILDEYKQECEKYFEMNTLINATAIDTENALKLHYLAALIYTVFTGRYYDGELKQDDLNMIKLNIENSSNEGVYIAPFMINFIGSFLDNRPVYVNERGQLYKVDKNGRSRKPFDWEEVLEDLWASVIELIAQS